MLKDKALIYYGLIRTIVSICVCNFNNTFRDNCSVIILSVKRPISSFEKFYENSEVYSSSKITITDN